MKSVPLSRLSSGNGGGMIQRQISRDIGFRSHGEVTAGTIPKRLITRRALCLGRLAVAVCHHGSRSVSEAR